MISKQNTRCRISMSYDHTDTHKVHRLRDVYGAPFVKK